MGALELSSLGVTVESPVEDFYDELEARRPRADTPTALADQLKGILGTTDIACDVRTPSRDPWLCVYLSTVRAPFVTLCGFYRFGRGHTAQA